MRMHNPQSPGEIINELCLEPLGLMGPEAVKGEVAGRVFERRDFLLSEGGANRDRKMAGELQHQAAAQRARLQAACPRGL